MRDHFLGQLAQIHDVHREPGEPALRTGQRQQTVDEIRQPVDLLEHAADHRPVRRLVVPLAQPDLAHTAHRGQRRAQLVRHVGREPSHLRERRLEAGQHLVEHRGQAAQLVVRVGDRQPLAQAIRRDRMGAFDDAVDGHQRAARERVPAHAGGGHRQRQAEDERDHQVAQRPPHAGLGSGDLDDHRLAGDLRMPAQHANRHGRRRDRDDGIVGVQRQPPALRNRLALGHRGPEHQRPVRVPHLQPRVVLVGGGTLEPRHGPIGPLLGHFGRPMEIPAQAVVERSRRALVDEDQEARRVDTEHDDHRADVPDGQTQPDTAGTRPAHGSPSRRMNPTPRTV